MKTGNTGGDDCQLRRHAQPQWSPVMKTGNTAFESQLFMIVGLASMEPGHEDREYHGRDCNQQHQPTASMEPGHEDREYLAGVMSVLTSTLPQWSPVMKTGNTTSRRAGTIIAIQPQWSPVMKTGNTWGAFRTCPTR